MSQVLLYGGLIVAGLLLRTALIYSISRFLFVDKRNVPAKSSAAGIFGGLLTLPVLFLPLGSILSILLDAYIVKLVFDSSSLKAWVVVIFTLIASEVLFLIFNILV
jgi:hypothetical protein